MILQLSNRGSLHCPARCTIVIAFCGSIPSANLSSAASASIFPQTRGSDTYRMASASAPIAIGEANLWRADFPRRLSNCFRSLSPFTHRTSGGNQFIGAGGSPSQSRKRMRSICPAIPAIVINACDLTDSAPFRQFIPTRPPSRSVS